MIMDLNEFLKSITNVESKWLSQGNVPWAPVLKTVNNTY